MKSTHSPTEGRLRGQAVLLSASIPKPERNEIYSRIEVAEAISEAVVSLARAVFSEGGTLVFGGHPTISPLVASVVAEYLLPRTVEGGRTVNESEQWGPKVEIYQSKAYWNWIAESTMHLQQQPGVSVQWIEAVEGEKADPNIRNKPQARKSLAVMRSKMIHRKDLSAMVCIGGMEGVEEEIKMFHQVHPSLPVYVFESTEGAAKNFAHQCEDGEWLRIAERGVRESIESWRRQQGSEAMQGKQAGEEQFAVPYPYVAQKIVSEIIGAEDEPS